MDSKVERPKSAVEKVSDPIRYTAYIALLTKVLKYLRSYYGSVEAQAQTSEGESMAVYADKFLATVRALALKNRFSPLYLRRPSVNLTDSGFPSYYDITQLESDLSTRGERLPKLLTVEEGKELLLEHIMSGAAPSELTQHTEQMMRLLWQVSERAYLDQLDIRAQFFQFTPGKLTLLEENDAPRDRRNYIFSWGCYDSQQNRPCVYFMLFAQDSDEKPLDAPNNPEYLKFLETVRQVAARAPEKLQAIAVQLDESFKTLYPKVLKRFCIGPLVSPLLHKVQDIDPRSLEARLLPAFARAGLEEDDFALLFSTEFLRSDREEVIQRFLPFNLKARQIFYIPKNDRELLRRGASAAATYVLLPHRLLQHLSSQDTVAVPELAHVQYVVYQPEGDVTDVG